MFVKSAQSQGVYRRLGTSLLIAFVISTLFSPFVHALPMNMNHTFGAESESMMASVKLQDDHGHGHNDWDDVAPSPHKHEHNPADHSHDIPAVFSVPGGEFTVPEDDVVSPHGESYLSYIINELNRPPRT